MLLKRVCRVNERGFSNLLSIFYSSLKPSRQELACTSKYRRENYEGGTWTELAMVKEE
jgi:hypothetical protein